MSNQNITVSISGQAPGYQVTLSPSGPYNITQPGTTLTLMLDRNAVQDSFQIAGIGFDGRHHGQSTIPAESQLTASITTTNQQNDTLVVTDSVTQEGQFEFILLYRDKSGVIYGLDPEVLNEPD
jgi:hypothetical protein